MAHDAEEDPHATSPDIPLPTTTTTTAHEIATQNQGDADAGVDGKQLKEFVSFIVLPPIPVNVIREHILPLLDRVSFNRLCSTHK
jgi:hypothetical protein